ncbi:hypothetical protein ScalyP_jg2301 [Parmales sp. scaly parma]|nr:hypothetical protein ScalyP_jg2301 [Parmales sp. scaly parma]
MILPMLSVLFFFLSSPLTRLDFITSSSTTLSIGSFFGNGQIAPPAPLSPRTLGSTDITVSPLALGTQRWVSSDFNAPDQATCFDLLDTAYDAGVRTIDTAEQYPIPSDSSNPEGATETTIGNWLKARPNIDRKSMTIVSKITGSTNVSKNNIEKDLDGTLRRLQTSYLDVYLLHWPQRYSPQSNWGQSLKYNANMEYKRAISFEELVATMDKMVKKGKIRGWGLCNDSAYGLTKASVIAKANNLNAPCTFQGDFSLLDRKSEENGVLETCSLYNEDIGFMAYNVLAGGILTGKYGSKKSGGGARGRFDDRGWGGTLYRYRSGPALEAVAQYSKLAKDENMELGELAIRWALEREGVDTLLLGHSNVDQLKEQIGWAKKGKLGDGVGWEIDRVHMRNRNPIFANDDVPKEWAGTGLIGEQIP